MSNEDGKLSCDERYELHFDAERQHRCWLRNINHLMTIGDPVSEKREIVLTIAIVLQLIQGRDDDDGAGSIATDKYEFVGDILKQEANPRIPGLSINQRKWKT